MWKRKISMRLNYSDIKKLASASLIFFFFSFRRKERKDERKEGRREGGKEGKREGKREKGKERGKERRLS